MIIPSSLLNPSETEAQHIRLASRAVRPRVPDKAKLSMHQSNLARITKPAQRGQGLGARTTAASPSPAG